MIIEEKASTRANSKRVWQVWKQNYELPDQEGLKKGKKGKVIASGKRGKASFEILEVKENESFKIKWKGFFITLLFTHWVAPAQKGSDIGVRVEFKGLGAFVSSLFAGKKIRNNISKALKQFALDVEK